ncbi:acyltransferase family protein [Demetria terragena]|uniref:acyltransferase family protein n=1 Tax=Demetria terragena TaxID=63959 RepID=UPI00037EC232|nr:acyltransferase family protein [Demetria terragena]
MSPSQPASTSPAKAPARVALWDHARYLLLFFIVTAHTLETLRQSSDAAYLIYLYFYLFHVAALLTISGYFSKPEINVKAVRSVIQLIVIWLIWEVIFALVHFYIDDEKITENNIIVPSWGLWFLLTLASLRILLPIIMRLRRPMLVSILLALGAGLVPAIGTDYSAARTLFFLPFFVAGYLAKDRGWSTQEWFARPSVAVRAAAGGVFVIIAAVLLAFPNLEERWRIDRWALGRNSYQDLLKPGSEAALEGLRSFGVGEKELITEVAGVLLRASVMGVGAAMTLALLLLVPRRSLGFQRQLSRTLYIYLIHLLILVLMRNYGIISDIGDWGLLGILTLVVFAGFLTVILSTDLVAKVARPIIEPNVDWLIRRDELPTQKKPSPAPDAKT